MLKGLLFALLAATCIPCAAIRSEQEAAEISSDGEVSSVSAGDCHTLTKGGQCECTFFTDKPLGLDYKQRKVLTVPDGQVKECGVKPFWIMIKVNDKPYYGAWSYEIGDLKDGKREYVFSDKLDDMFVPGVDQFKMTFCIQGPGCADAADKTLVKKELKLKAHDANVDLKEESRKK